MKRLTGLTIIGLMLAVGVAASAPGQNIERRLAQMQKRLNLTPDQVSKIRPVLEDQNRRIQELRSQAKEQKGSVDRAQLKQELQALRQDSQKQIKAALTGDQQAKLQRQQKRVGRQAVRRRLAKKRQK